MQVRDRIKELRRVRASELRPNAKNWRLHPASQQNALRGVLAEIGYADALVARELEDGGLELIDGHLRAETTPGALVPVLVVDLSSKEADMLLAVHDPLSAMAQADGDMLAGLVENLETDNAALRELLDSLAGSDETLPQGEDAAADDSLLAEHYQVVVECQSEEHQREVYERLVGEGLPCRLLTI